MGQLDRVFVYGTLMRGVAHPMAELLSRSADFLGEARCQGRLYMIAHYPGLIQSDDPRPVENECGTSDRSDHRK